MATLEYLDDERTKLWHELNLLKQKLDDAVAKLSQVDKASAETVKSQLTALDSKIGEVRRLAESKTPEDVQTASRAAQETVKKKDEVVKLAADTQEARDRLATAKRGLEKIQQSGEVASVIMKDLEAAQAQIGALKTSIETDAAGLKKIVEKCEKFKTDLDVSSQNASTNAKNVATLNKQAEDATSMLEASKKTFSDLKSEMEDAKSEFETIVSDSKSDFDEFRSKSKESFDSLIKEKTKALNDLTVEIEKLLPPASTASISKSFEDRKTDVLKGKWIWTALLIASVIAIVSFGCVSLWIPSPNSGVMTIFTRFVIISGLVILEEFARRNYSAVFRLSEAYAYKEAICKSLVGFKKELGSIPLPKKGEEDVAEQASAELAATFLAKLGDEPAAKVFEKNKPVFGLLQAFFRMVNPPGGEELKPEMVLTIANGLGKFSWQIVVAIGIIAASILAIIAMFIR